EHGPTRIRRVALRIVVRVLRIEGGVIRVTRLHDLDDARDARFRAARMVEERAVAALHVVAHEVARLIVADAVPASRLAWSRGEVVDTEGRRLRLHEPITHSRTSRAAARGQPRPKRRTLASVTTPHSGTSHRSAGRCGTCCSSYATPRSFGRCHDLRPCRKRKQRS